MAQTLGRPLSNNATNVTINLLKPGDVFGERVNQLDFRVGKILRFGRQRATVSADLLNALNTDAILGYNQELQPDDDLAGRDVGVDGPLDEDHGAVGFLTPGVG